MVADNKRQTTSNKKEACNKGLAQLLKEGRCGEKNHFYFLPGREKIVAIRKKRERWSLAKCQKAGKIAGILRLIFWIRLIGVTGSLARNNSDKKDDIDLFIITSQNRIWLTRGLIVLILKVLRVYRQPEKITDKICPNMFVAESNLKMEPEDLFIAQEICAVKPIFEKGNTYQKFLQANLWVKKFLPNRSVRNATHSVAGGQQTIGGFLVVDWLEKGVQSLQMKYMENRRTKETISESLIKFHPQDARRRVLEEYQKKIKSIL